MFSRAQIPYGKQNITDEDLKAVTEVLKSDFLTQGPKIVEFEIQFAKYIGVNYAVAVSNGTAALHLGAMALGILPGDKVITTPITFAASANCVQYCGGEIVFADIDPNTYLIDLDSVENILKSAPIGTYKGIIPVDFAGRAVDMERLSEISKEYSCWILEDACHAPGASFNDSEGEKQFCGNCNFADLAIFSFHPVKHIACGEGGMITTNDKILYNKLLTLRTHGITKNTELFENSIEFAIGDNNSVPNEYPLWYMEMQSLGYNYRLTDFQAALGLSQMKRADTGLTRRREIAEIYSRAFNNSSFIQGHSGYEAGHAYHLYIIEVLNRKGLYDYLRDNSIFCQIHYIPVHLMPYYRHKGWKEGDFKHAENYYKKCISLPMYPTLKEEEQNFVIQKINEFYN